MKEDFGKTVNQLVGSFYLLEICMFALGLLFLQGSFITNDTISAILGVVLIGYALLSAVTQKRFNNGGEQK